MSTIQDEWRQAASPEERRKLLAVGGRKAAVRENKELVRLYKEHRTGLWPFCVAHALVQSTHARAAATWYPAVAEYLRSGDRTHLAPARGHSSSFGPDALQRALVSFRTIGEFAGIAGASQYDAKVLTRAQERAVQYAMTQTLSGLGAWLFCAPFELMALARPSLWEDPVLDQLLLPLGSALARGYGMLSAAGLADVDEQLLRDSEPGIRNGLTLLYIARGCDEKLAQQCGARALFCHQGVAELGRVR